MTREQRAEDIDIICAKSGCTTKQRKLHFKMFVDRHCQPHASLRFKTWWFNQDEFKNSKDKDGFGISPVVAQNVARIWTAYLEAKQMAFCSTQPKADHPCQEDLGESIHP